jgi:hypothetical protein
MFKGLKLMFKGSKLILKGSKLLTLCEENLSMSVHSHHFSGVSMVSTTGEVRTK